MAGEWRVLPFSHAVLLNPGVHLERGTAYPFVDMAAVNSSTRSVQAISHREYSGGGSRFRSGDTLMARITPCLENGKIARFDPLTSESMTAAHGSTEFIVLRGRPNVTDTDFVYYLTKWPEVRNYAIGQMTGTSGRQRVPTDCFDHLTIAIPPLPKQHAIAHILGTLDDKIELNRRMNETLEAMARALFKDWFVDFGPTRTKIEGRDPYLAPEIWDLFPDKLDEDGKPEGWEVFRLNQIAKHHTEVLSPAATPDTEFEHFSLPAFDAGRRPAIDKGLSIKSNKTLVPKRAVLLSKLNPEIPRVWLPEDPSQRQQIGSTEFLALVPSVIAGRALLFCLFSDDRFREMLQSMVTGTSKSHQRISPKSLYEREVIAGNIQLFARFEELAHYLLVKTLANRSEAWTLAQARDLLLPNLVSGEIRVGDIDKIVKELT